MAGGTFGSIVVSQVSAGHKNRLALEINAARASVPWSQEDPGVVWIGRRGEVNTIRARDAAMAPDLDLPPGHPFGWRDALRRNPASVYAAISGEKPSLPFATFEDGHRSLVLLEAAINSSSTGA
jgi:predicted dehydrogenase